MRSQWNLFFDKIPIMGIIFVVNVSEDIERIKEARQLLTMVVAEPVLQSCTFAIVFNVKQKGKEERGGNAKNDHEDNPKVPKRKRDEIVECPFQKDHLDKLFKLTKIFRKKQKHQSFMFDVGQPDPCKGVFRWMSARIEEKLVKKGMKEDDNS